MTKAEIQQVKLRFGIIGNNEALMRAIDIAIQVAPTDLSVLITGVNYTAGLPVVRTSPAHGTAYDIAGKGIASEDSFRQAVYVAIDVFRNRMREQEAHANPLRKQYYERRDDSDKLKLDSTEEDL